jgi:hypothetical protein
VAPETQRSDRDVLNLLVKREGGGHGTRQKGLAAH